MRDDIDSAIDNDDMRGELLKLEPQQMLLGILDNGLTMLCEGHLYLLIFLHRMPPGPPRRAQN
jgi:hypothetical protein